MASRFVLAGGSVDTAGVRRLDFVEGTRDTASATQVAPNLRTARGIVTRNGVQVRGSIGAMIFESLASTR